MGEANQLLSAGVSTQRQRAAASGPPPTKAARPPTKQQRLFSQVLDLQEGSSAFEGAELGAIRRRDGGKRKDKKKATFVREAPLGSRRLVIRGFIQTQNKRRQIFWEGEGKTGAG